HVVNWISTNLEPGNVFVDVGSHIGYYLGPGCRHIGVDGRAFFIEPSKEHFSFLLKNIKDNQFSMAIPLNLALSDHSGEIQFFPAKDSGRNSLKKNSVTNEPTYAIQALTLDDFMQSQSLDHIDLLQLDVEGAEALILKGSKHTLEKNRIETILCEWHPKQIREDFKHDPMAIIHLILQLGYTIFRLDTSGRISKFLPEHVDQYLHLILRKGS
ncbi:MAG: FkbM family methyltransferase, partial [Bacillota bacterium]